MAFVNQLSAAAAASNEEIQTNIVNEDSIAYYFAKMENQPDFLEEVYFTLPKGLQELYLSEKVLNSTTISNGMRIYTGSRVIGVGTYQSPEATDLHGYRAISRVVYYEDDPEEMRLKALVQPKGFIYVPGKDPTPGENFKLPPIKKKDIKTHEGLTFTLADLKEEFDPSNPVDFMKRLILIDGRIKMDDMDDFFWITDSRYLFTSLLQLRNCIIYFIDNLRRSEVFVNKLRRLVTSQFVSFKNMLNAMLPKDIKGSLLRRSKDIEIQGLEFLREEPDPIHVQFGQTVLNYIEEQKRELLTFDQGVIVGARDLTWMEAIDLPRNHTLIEQIREFGLIDQPKHFNYRKHDLIDRLIFWGSRSIAAKLVRRWNEVLAEEVGPLSLYYSHNGSNVLENFAREVFGPRAVRISKSITLDKFYESVIYNTKVFNKYVDMFKRLSVRSPTSQKENKVYVYRIVRSMIQQDDPDLSIVELLSYGYYPDEGTEFFKDIGQYIGDLKPLILPFIKKFLKSYALSGSKERTNKKNLEGIFAHGRETDFKGFDPKTGQSPFDPRGFYDNYRYFSFIFYLYYTAGMFPINEDVCEPFKDIIRQFFTIVFIGENDDYLVLQPDVEFHNEQDRILFDSGAYASDIHQKLMDSNYVKPQQIKPVVPVLSRRRRVIESAISFRDIAPNPFQQHEQRGQQQGKQQGKQQGRQRGPQLGQQRGPQIVQQQGQERGPVEEEKE